MKAFNKMNFGIQAVQAGQKAVNAILTPILTANSTVGKFTMSPLVSKALNVAVGENVMFLNNIAGIESAIQNRVEDVVQYASENNIDLDTHEGVQRILADFTQWFVGKGVPQFKPNGEPLLYTERFTKEEKQRYLDLHRMEIVAANRDELKAQFGDLSDETLAEHLTIDIIESPKSQACSGSKTATTATATGTGCKLNFTDSSIWKMLKENLGENMTKMNRTFKVRLDLPTVVDYHNGKESVKITIYPIEYLEDTEAIARVKVSAE
nr:MAG TPA: hypothetical protein [Crassvirales sp.]